VRQNANAPDAQWPLRLRLPARDARMPRPHGNQAARREATIVSLLDKSSNRVTISALEERQAFSGYSGERPYPCYRLMHTTLGAGNGEC
jgi:hypothetical protein